MSNKTNRKNKAGKSIGNNENGTGNAHVEDNGNNIENVNNKIINNIKSDSTVTESIETKTLDSGNSADDSTDESLEDKGNNKNVLNSKDDKNNIDKRKTDNIQNNAESKDNTQDTDDKSSKESNKNDEDLELKESDCHMYFEDDVLCRICYDDGQNEPLVVPCTCKGTMAFVHKTCLERWLAESNSSACELCHYRYNTQRATKYKVCEAICKWLRYSDEDYDFPGRNVRTDIVVCCMLTPFAFIGSGLCILTADYYSNERFSKIPAARWTSISLLLMIGIVVIGYYLWVYMVVRYHGQMWYAWWQRDSIVKVIIADVNRVP